MNNLKIKSLRGMHDYLPNDIYIYKYIENCIRKIMCNYSFKEIRFPLIEKTELFNKSISKNCNISLKEMYSFIDRSGRNLSLRPEGTIGCSRAYIQNNLFLEKFFNKLWYIGPMFRYEKPQKGRLREFYQVGMEIFGSNSFFLDIELLIITKRLWNNLGINNFLCLEINNIGSILDRNNYISFIIKNFGNDIKKFFGSLNNINLFRLLDNKNNKFYKIFSNFPKIIDFINKKSLLNFDKICNKLDLLGIKYKINNYLVRGIDYYNDFVFEWKSNFLNKKYTVCAGGRYNNLISNLSGMYIPAVGCALGLERLFIFLNDCKSKILNYFDNIDIYILSSYNNKSKILGITIVEKILNSNLNSLKIYNDYILKIKINKLILKIIKSNIRILIIIDKREINGNYITLKDLYLNYQKKININNLIFFLNKLINKKK